MREFIKNPEGILIILGLLFLIFSGITPFYNKRECLFLGLGFIFYGIFMTVVYLMVEYFYKKIR